MTDVHGGMKFYRGSPAAARAYVEADHSRADDYYLSEGAGVAIRYVAQVGESASTPVRRVGHLDGSPTNSGSPGTTSTPTVRKVACETTRMRCGSSRSPSTVRRLGRSPHRCIPKCLQRWTRHRVEPLSRSSGGLPDMRPPASVHVVVKCRYRWSGSRQR